MELKYKNEKFELAESIERNYLTISDNHFKIVDDDLLRNCFVTEDDKYIYVFIDGQTYHFEKVEEEQDFSEDGGGSSSDREEIKPPMPGSVVKILVEAGQKVADGDGLIIVEAMKMETTLYASIAGVVKEINVKEAEQVDADKKMIIIAKEQI
jgi:biotin carboxyl carrier protein